MRALVLAEVPDPYVATAIATDQFSLVWVNDHIVDRDTVGVVALDIA